MTTQEAIKNLKPCKCGGLPSVTIENDTSKSTIYKRIECQRCGKRLESNVYTLDWLVNEWNKKEQYEEVEMMWPKTNPVQYGMFRNYGRTRIDPFEIERVIFNDPATIVFWKDGTKTVVKATDEPFDEEKGLAMAIVKKVYGNKGNYFNKIKKFLISRYVDDEGEVE